MQDRRFLHPTDEDLSVGIPVCWSRRFECIASVYSISENAIVVPKMREEMGWALAPAAYVFINLRFSSG